MILEFWIMTPLLFTSGYLLGRLHNRRWRVGIVDGKPPPPFE
jgi:DMSO/TMAO reductase YedYZ heme-binding membrane subunit